MVQEFELTSKDFIYPIFVTADQSSKIKSMPKVYRHSPDDVLREIETCIELGIDKFAIFPVVEEQLKNPEASEAINERNLNIQTIKNIKRNFPQTLLVSDIALDPYTDHGHDGLIKNAVIDNDSSIELLSQMALIAAQAGADIVAPSDMMDGRVAKIREILEKNNFTNTIIMSYTAKYASSLYAPFREALGSLGTKSIKSGIPSDKLTYQMDYHNSKEALRELDLDISETADIVMVKPASWYLDIIHQFKQGSNIPVAAYQVSGEYSMIHAAAQLGYIELDKAINESLTAIKRAGADIIISYFAKQFLKKK
jgi:porphobilinogen synthase